MSRTLWRLRLRYLLRHPWQIGLSVLGIALGVAVAVSIDLANESARRAFALATEAVTGRATHQIVGGPSGLSEEVYRTLRSTLGVWRAAPVVAADVAAIEHPGRTLHLFGIDPFAEAPFRSLLTGGGAASSPAPRGASFQTLSALVARPGTGLVSRATARELGLEPGGRLAIRVGGVRRSVTLIGWLEPADAVSARALESLLVTDIATAQELLGAPGRLSRIDLIVGVEAESRGLLDRIRGTLPPDAELVPAGARAEATARMTRAFALNLTALSLLALVVGMFLIYNAMTFSVVERRPLLGTLRALGMTRRELFTLVMAEAAVVGALGTAAGLALGVGLAQGLLRLVTQTINDLYFVLSVREVVLSPLPLLKGACLGMGATLAAAVAPALEATGARPRAALVRSILERRARRVVPRAALGGLGCALAGAGALALPQGGPGLGFAGLFALLMGAALVTPAAALGLLWLLQPIVAGALGLLGRMAARGIAAALSRTAVAMSALMIAVAATVGVGIMIGSFRSAVVGWLEATLGADVYVSPPSLVGARPDSTLDPALVERLLAAPGVGRASTSRAAVVSSPEGPVRLVIIGPEGRRPTVRLRDGDPGRVWPAFDRGAVLVSEPYAYRSGLGAGGSVRLRTDRGEQEFPVAGVFSDYGSSAGVLVMGRATYDRFWDDRAVSALALEAAPGVETGALIESLRRGAGEEQEVVIRSNRALREASLEIFDRTFLITDVLRLLTIAVAFVGVLSALLALQIEREREMGTLRALGLTPRQVWGMVTAQTGLMGLVAGVLAIPVGVMLSAVLIHVINRRSFGWTMPMEVAPAGPLQGLVLALVAALLAGLYPAWKMARAVPAEALREE